MMAYSRQARLCPRHEAGSFAQFAAHFAADGAVGHDLRCSARDFGNHGGFLKLPRLGFPKGADDLPGNYIDEWLSKLWPPCGSPKYYRFRIILGPKKWTIIMTTTHLSTDMGCQL